MLLCCCRNRLNPQRHIRYRQIPWRTTRINRILTKRKHITLNNRHRFITSIIVQHRQLYVIPVHRVLRRVIPSTIIGLISPIKINRVHTSRNCGLNLHPMRLTRTPTLIRTMQHHPIRNSFNRPRVRTRLARNPTTKTVSLNRRNETK